MQEQAQELQRQVKFFRLDDATPVEAAPVTATADPARVVELPRREVVRAAEPASRRAATAGAWTEF
jgi:methyl-accepting chemotaxis protein